MTTDDGVGLEVIVEGEGPGLMLVHGFGGAKEDFTDYVGAFAREHTVVTFDHRGHGASDKPDDPAAYSLDRLRRDTLQVAEATGLTTFRLLGHSMGGMVAGKVVIGAPERIDALIMMDTCAAPIPGIDPSLLDTAAEVALTQGKAALIEMFAAGSPLDTPAYLRTLAERPGYAEFVARKEADLSAVMWGALAREMAHQDDDLARLADALHCPFLIIVGEQDAPFLLASQAMADAIPHAQMRVISDAGHSPQFENGDEWFEVLHGFLASLPAVAR